MNKMIVILFLLLAQLGQMIYAQESGTQLAFISDTQAPRWIEDVFLKNHRNTEATQLLFKDVLAQDPSNVFILGDLVNLGYKKNRWRAIDKFLIERKGKKAPVYAVLGNHELMGKRQKGEKNFQERFPDHVSSGYLVIVDSVAIVLLNSNFHAMLPAQILKQDAWYKQTLQTLEENNAIHTIMVCCHHSPYSNSKLVGNNKNVQDRFVKPFMTGTKTKLFLSGHAHLFQHFKKATKHFLVIGGGGGLKHPLKSSLMEDESGGYQPLFQYIILNVKTSNFKITSRCIKKDYSGFEEGYSFVMK